MEYMILIITVECSMALMYGILPRHGISDTVSR